MRKITIGNTYHALLNDEPHTYVVEEYDSVRGWYGVVWDDGDSELLYPEDIERMTDDFYLFVLESASAGCK